MADDDVDMRDMVAAVLRADGYDVTEARDGLDLLLRLATARLEGREFDAILSDMRMPVVGGLDAAERLRRANVETPLVLMTAFSDSAVRARVRALGATLVEKPFELDDLRKTMLEVSRHAGK